MPLVEGGVNKSMNKLAMSEAKESIDFLVYPNPASNILNFFYKGTQLATHVTVSNTLGTVVYQADVKPNSKTEISLSNFDTGVYLLTAYNGKLKVYQTKVMCIK